MQQSIKINTATYDASDLAAKIVDKAYTYSSRIEITAGKKTVSAKSLVGLISLMLEDGEYITLYTEGPDEIFAADELSTYLSSGVI